VSGTSGTSGSSGTSPTNWATQLTTTNAIYYPTFVNSNNASPALENGFTNADLQFNPGKTQLYSPNIAVGTGSVSQPSFTFIGDDNTGFYSPGPDILGIVTGGTIRASVNATGTVVLGDNTRYGALNFAVYAGATTTTNNTVTLASINPDWPAWVLVEARFVVRRVASPENGGGGIVRAVFESATGTWVRLGLADSFTRYSTGFSLTVPSIDLNVTSNEITLRASGATGITLNWLGKISWFMNSL
jgi:hypothetical protein